MTHVIRGDDLLSSTPRQKLLLEALGHAYPVTAHLPMILGADKKRLSKRHGAASVEEFRDAGYLPEAVVNYLALVGWSFDDSTEIMSVPELVERFTIDRVSASPGVFDHQKLAWMNGVHLRDLDPGLYAGRLRAFLRDRGSPIAERPEIDAVVPLVQEKIATLGEFEEFAGFLFHPVVYERGRLAEGGGRARGGGRPGRVRRRRWRPRRRLRARPSRGGAARRVGAARREAARRLPAAARGDLGPHDLARPVRVDRAARPRRVARAAARRPRPPVAAPGRRSRPGRETFHLRFPQQTATIQMPLLRDAAWGV